MELNSLNFEVKLVKTSSLMNFKNMQKNAIIKMMKNLFIGKALAEWIYGVLCTQKRWPSSIFQTPSIIICSDTLQSLRNVIKWMRWSLFSYIFFPYNPMRWVFVRSLHYGILLKGYRNINGIDEVSRQQISSPTQKYICSTQPIGLQHA